MTRLLPLVPLLLLAGCGSGGDNSPQDLAALDRELAADATTGRDPALAAALAAPMMADPALARSANSHAVRPADQPPSLLTPASAVPADPVGDVPPVPARAQRPDCPDCAAADGALTIGALGERQHNRQIAGCAAGIGYSAGWALRLPAATPLYPGARLVEAAGNDNGSCRLRIVAFAAGGDPAKVAAFYRQRAVAANFTAEVQVDAGRRVIGGTRGNDAFIVYAAPHPGGGSDVQLIVNGG